MTYDNDILRQSEVYDQQPNYLTNTHTPEKGSQDQMLPLSTFLVESIIIK